MGDKIDEWQIDGFHSSAEEKNKSDAHIFFLRIESLKKKLIADGEADQGICMHE